MDAKNRILVVDDDRTHLDMAEAVISESYDVTLAMSGAQALEILRVCDAPDLILLDVDMPDMDGFETFTQIRSVPELTDIPVIFLTGMTGVKTELLGLRLGAQDYVTKPFVRENLLARIRLRLEGGRQARQLRDLRARLARTDMDEERFVSATRALTTVEREVARLILRGCGNQEIAMRLSYSHGYVKNLVTTIYDKLDVCGRAELRRMFQPLSE